jgi:hypothetical protein
MKHLEGPSDVADDCMVYPWPKDYLSDPVYKRLLNDLGVYYLWAFPYLTPDLMRYMVWSG